MNTNQALRDRLQELHGLTKQTPLFNPVFQLSLDVSRELESGALTLGAMGGLVSDLDCEALQSRAKRIGRLLAPVLIDENLERLREIANTSATSLGFDGYCARWGQPLLHAVFTGHPTFLLTPAQSDAVAEAASTGDTAPATLCLVEADRPPITLAGARNSCPSRASRGAASRIAMGRR